MDRYVQCSFALACQHQATRSAADVPTGWSPPSPPRQVTLVVTIQAFSKELYFIGLLRSREMLPLDVRSCTLRWICMPAIQKMQWFIMRITSDKFSTPSQQL